MKPRRIYYRKKAKSIILEGRTPDAKPLHIWTLPDANTLTLIISGNASFLTREKAEEIKQKYERLDYLAERKKKSPPEFRLININGSPQKDADVKQEP